VVISVPDVEQADAVGDAVRDLDRFREAFYRSLSSRADALFEMTDAVLCADGPVRSLAELSLMAEHRRGHGASYDALADGRIDVDRLRTAVTAGPVPRAADNRIVLAVDVTSWLRPEAHTAAERILCHTYGRGPERLGTPRPVTLRPGRPPSASPADQHRTANLCGIRPGTHNEVAAELIALETGALRRWVRGIQTGT
jgi:hypothetical protein